MSRHQQLRRYGAGAVAVVCAIGAAILGLLAFGGGQAAAAGSSVTATMTTNGVQTSSSPGGTSTVTITTGDTVVFKAGPPPQNQGLGYQVTLHSQNLPGAPSSVKLNNGQTYSVTFGSAGSYGFSWTPSYALGDIKPTGPYGEAGTVVVNDPPPPPVTDTPTPTDTSTDTGVPTDSSTPTDGSTSSAPGSTPTDGSTGTAASGVGGSGGSGGGTGSGSHGTAIPIVNGTLGAVSHGGSVLRGFAPPGPDSGGGVLADGQHLAGTGVVPTGAGVDAVATSAAAATGPSFVTANVSHKVSPPTALAIIAILALAIVSSVCAHRFLGGALLLRLPRRRG